jgi:hypothetical protein
MRVWDLDCTDCDNECDVQVYIPGPPGPPLTDVGSLLVPVVITSAIAAPLYRRQRSFISVVAPVTQPTIPNPGDNGPWEFFLYVATGSEEITLNDAANLKLSGQWIGSPDSILYLQWDGNSRYVEAGRNEI